MKKTLVILTIVLALAPAAQATSYQHLKENAARNADSLYRAAKYEEAAKEYEQVLAAGYTSADLYYNLGNTYYRLGLMGQSILNYERALRLNPGMDDAKENLELANSKTVDRITVMPRLFLVKWYNALCTGITPGTWQAIVLILLALVGAAVALFFLARRIGVRKGALISVAGFGVLLLLSVLFLVVSTLRFNAREGAIVIQPTVTVKSSPELQSVDKLILHEGTKVSVGDSLSGWYKITLADGTTGWCQTENIERI